MNKQQLQGLHEYLRARKVRKAWEAACARTAPRRNGRALAAVGDDGTLSLSDLGILCEMAVAAGVTTRGADIRVDACETSQLAPGCTGATAATYGPDGDHWQLPAEVAQWAGLRYRY